MTVWEIVTHMSFPVHLLDDENRKLVNPVVITSGWNPASEGYAEGGGVITTPHTGGTQLDGVQKDGAYVTPEHKLNPGVMYSEEGTAKGPNLAEIDKVSAQARQDLLDEINKFPSKSKAGEYATMIGAYDPLTGKTAIGGSNMKISADMLHVDTVKYIEDKLGVKTGEFTSFCKNKVGACAEISAADSLVRQGVDPSRIRFTEALRPREVWRKETLTDKAVVETCKNCGASWPKGS
ncbi:hypothetical protein SAMN05216178_6433 [Pseudomonas saponiphila]|uniref:Filamentous hemagglutinin n=1 Tax=Pseudomonas saponiphila TaxID=556534 RepID=A0A1H4YA19_9PSED|nr:hypothetical protein [Pseudomonas saponiphila]SED14743.1 hypothetical protein SAMN05216178_6433 [Pseudomonas saponiphila]